MTLKEQILKYIADHPGATDTDMEKAFNAIHQQVNYACRMLEKDGKLIRRKPDTGGLIGNYPASADDLHSVDSDPSANPNRQKAAKRQTGVVLEEEEIKHILTDKLSSEGWSVITAWGHTPGVDIDARRGDERWLIEVKGPGSRPQMRVNYFLSMLGEVLQRMDDPRARYSIALPDLPQYHGLWERLPSLAKQRTGIDALFVDGNGEIRI